MDIIEYLLYESYQADFIETLEMFFGKKAVQAAHQLGIIKFIGNVAYLQIN